ncbi:hypothetical protein EVAR_74040_1 [Eumeta japonica]|uniref:Uncharacterized protein n=1 Tax=Eumeta variegata TaxID=151549 RepID=A0A4C1SSH5_EUMVA|nr:hypothetical protein EVAR_74040_1 [Eumeta japonica]
MSETNSVSSLEHQVNKYLLSYRNSVHSTTGVSPAQLMLGRNVRTRLDFCVHISYYTGAVATTPSFRTPQAAYEHYNSDESDDDYTFVKCSPMLMTERGRRKSKPRQHEARIVRTSSLPKIAARS